MAPGQNHVDCNEQTPPLLEQTKATGGVAWGDEHAHAVRRALHYGAFIQDHLDSEVRGDLAKTTAQNCVVVPARDLMGRQSVGGHHPATREPRNGANVVEMLMRENDR